LRRIILWIVSLVLIAVVAIFVLRRDAAQVATGDPEVNTEGHFLSDSLGVSLFLPPSEGWRFRRDARVPGSAYITAIHDDDNPSVRLYVAATQPTTTMESVIEERRVRLAAFFNVDSLSTVIGRVMQEEVRDVEGHPVWQWQALTHPLTMEDGSQSRIMFMLTATVRPDFVYECVGMVLIPMSLLPEEQRGYDALVQDLAFVMQSFRVR